MTAVADFDGEQFVVLSDEFVEGRVRMLVGNDEPLLPPTLVGSVAIRANHFGDERTSSERRKRSNSSNINSAAQRQHMRIQG